LLRKEEVKMPSKDTTVISARIPDKTLALIKERISKKDKTLNAWINWAIKEGLRSHTKKGA